MGKPKSDKKKIADEDDTTTSSKEAAKKKFATDKSEHLIKKEKRPWRNKLRKKAKKEAALKERAANPASAPIISAPSDDSGKKKKKKRKKKYVEPEPVQEEDNSQEEEVKPDIFKDGMKKLEGGRFRYLNEQLYTMSGEDAWEFFKNDPSAFECYHSGFSEQVKKWPNHPQTDIIRWLGCIPDNEVIADLGCGEAKIAAAVGHRLQVHSFDLVAVNKRVTACNMAKLPMEDGIAQVAIFSLSLMGTNLYDYIKEARRILKVGGILKIAEVTSRFINVRQFCEAICKMGFEKRDMRKLTEFFMMLEFRKVEKVENKRPFGLKLKPCLYKKR